MSNWKKDTRTPGEQSQELYPFGRMMEVPKDVIYRRIAHVECLRYQVIPRDELIEELVAAIGCHGIILSQRQSDEDEFAAAGMTYGIADLNEAYDRLARAFANAREHGYGTP